MARIEGGVELASEMGRIMGAYFASPEHGVRKVTQRENCMHGINCLGPGAQVELDNGEVYHVAILKQWSKRC